VEILVACVDRSVFFGGILVFHVTTATRLRVARFAFRFFLAFLARKKNA